MTTLRKALFRMLCRTTVFEPVYTTQRLTSKKWLDNKGMHFRHNYFAATNQSVKEYQNAPDNILQGRPDNNYEADTSHN